MSVHQCPHCRCIPAPEPKRLNVNTGAPFWPFVVEVDALLYGRRVGKTYKL